MDHAFEFDPPHRRRPNTITMRSFACDPWPADLLAALSKLDLDAMRGGSRGTLATSKVHVRTDFAAGEFEVELIR